MRRRECDWPRSAVLLLSLGLMSAAPTSSYAVDRGAAAVRERPDNIRSGSGAPAARPASPAAISPTATAPTTTRGGNYWVPDRRRMVRGPDRAIIREGGKIRSPARPWCGWYVRHGGNVIIRLLPPAGQMAREERWMRTSRYVRKRQPELRSASSPGA